MGNDKRRTFYLYKAMNQYTIYCTEAQTKKALELGAPIKATFLDVDKKFEYEGCHILIPTAEQMIGWLEEQGSTISIEKTEFKGYWQGYVATTNYKDSISKNGCVSRKEAILTAIDVALEYIETHKQ